MNKVLVLVCTTAGSAVGWWMGAHLGIMSAFMLSMFGFGVGIWGGRRLGQRWSP